MSAYDILRKCGYSHEEALAKSGASKPTGILERCGMTAEEVRRAAERNNVRSKAEIAYENEAKYENVKDVELDWAERKYPGVYSEIESGTDNGNCTTRRGTYRELRKKEARHVSFDKR